MLEVMPEGMSAETALIKWSEVFFINVYFTVYPSCPDNTDTVVYYTIYQGLSKHQEVSSTPVTKVKKMIVFFGDLLGENKR